MSGPVVEIGNEVVSGYAVEIGSHVAGQAPLRLLHQTQRSLEKVRIQIGNRVSAIDRGTDVVLSEVERFHLDLHNTLVASEERIEELMLEAAKGYPIYHSWLSHVKGIGPGLASQLLAMLLPPLADRGPSTWYKAAGLTVEQRPDGEMRLPRARKAAEGETKAPALTYYPWLRRCLWNVAESFVRQGGYYRTIYEQRKVRLVEQHGGEWPPIRIDRVARWMMIKLFLAHLWEQWCAVEGISGRRAYVLEVLHHPHYLAPPEWDGNGKI